MKPNQSTHNQRGVSALEFTIIAPLVFVLVYGLIEFGCYFYDRAWITWACREGARAGVVARAPGDRLTEDNIQQVVLDYAQKHLITFGSGTLTKADITVVGAGGNFGDDLTVTVNYQYKFLVFPNFKNLGWVNSDFPGEIDLKAVTVMRME